MQIHPHNTRTLIAILLSSLEDWRRGKGMSRQTAAQEVVEAHERIGGPTTTGIEFADNPDAYKRSAVNCDRVYRWLDDATKETTLLPANMAKSVLAAFPQGYQIRALNEYLRELGLAVHPLYTSNESPAPAHLKDMLRETAEAAAAFTDLLDGATQEELIEAQQQLTEAEAAVKRNRAMVEGLLTMQGGRHHA